jgi:hypothetical protein
VATLAVMDKLLSGCKGKDRNKKTDSSKENEASSSREMLCKKPKCRKYDTKYLSTGFTNINADGDERPFSLRVGLIRIN